MQIRAKYLTLLSAESNYEVINTNNKLFNCIHSFQQLLLTLSPILNETDDLQYTYD